MAKFKFKEEANDEEIEEEFDEPVLKEVVVTESVEVKPEEVKVEKVLDDDEYIIEPDGSVSFRLDKYGCRKGFKWDSELRRCVPI